METTKTNNKGFIHWLRNSITARMLMIGFLILVLLIPLVYVQELIRERSERQEAVVNEVGRLWGEELLFTGPILKIPYKTYSESTKYDEETKKTVTERKTLIRNAFFLPDQLAIDAQLEAIKRKRGIYETSVYVSQMKIEGSFGVPDFKREDILPEDVLWEKASVIIRTSNLKGIKNQISMELGDSTTTFLPKYTQQDGNIYDPYYVTMHELESPLLSEKSIPKTDSLRFSTEMVVNGSQRIRFVPVGKETYVHMESDWSDPSHIGNFLPEEDDEKKQDASGFVANWKVFQTNRQFEQAFFGSMPDLKKFSFGTELLVPVDEYQKSERSAKYGYLVIALTFLVFFLIQNISKINIHPFQYLMIGLALVMFYTLLISISEHQNYLKAYLIAGASVVGLITLYSRSILKNFKFVLLVFSSLAALYSFIFVIIQLENYALLVGSIGLFLILATVMFASRRIDWSQAT